jgi:hypothetical protein
MQDIRARGRTTLTQHRDTFELQQSELPNRLKETSEKVIVHGKQSKNDRMFEHTQQILEFTESVDRYIDHVLPLDEAGNRPPRPARRSRKRAESHRHGSSLTSQSTDTTQTQSTQPSHHQASVLESPPTSPEPIHEDLPDEIRSKEEEAHNTSIQHAPPDAASQTSLGVPPVVSQPFPKPASTAKRGRECSCPQTRQTRPSSRKPILPSNAGHETKVQYQAKQSIDPVIHEGGDTDALQDDISEEEETPDEQARETGPSIWQATGGFEGHMPKGLRLRRQRSRSPQDFW